MEVEAPAPPPPPPPRRGGLLTAFLALVAVGGSAVGVGYYQMTKGSQKIKLDTSGFDISQALEGPKASGTAAPEKPGMGMMAVKTDGLLRSTRERKAAPTFEDVFRDAVRKAEAPINSLALKYLAQHPAAREFAKDWMAEPELAYASRYYAANKDPVFFLKYLAGTDAFPRIVRKWATNGTVQTFVKQAIQVVPPQSFDAGLKYIEKEGAVKPVVDRTMSALGIPPGMLGTAAQGPPKVDAGAVMSGVLGSNPGLQKALESNPEAQQALQQPQGAPTR